MNYKLLNNRTLLEFEDKSDIAETKSGVTLYQAGYWDPLQHTNQDAVVKRLPAKLTRHMKNFDVELEEGDRVFVHHFICQPERWFEYEGKEYAELDYTHIYCKKEVDGEIEMIQDFIFLERAFFSEETCKSPGGLWLQEFPDEIHSCGWVRHVNKHTKDFKVGDLVAYSRLSDYEMSVDGKKYLRMRNSDICAILDPEHIHVGA